jgi:hypothetical protein
VKPNLSKISLVDFLLKRAHVLRMTRITLLEGMNGQFAGFSLESAKDSLSFSE